MTVLKEYITKNITTRFILLRGNHPMHYLMSRTHDKALLTEIVNGAFRHVTLSQQEKADTGVKVTREPELGN